MPGEIEKPVFRKGRSRLGCTNCKKSKVKCDEVHPSCKRCLKRGTHCSYPFQVSFEKIMGMPQDEKMKSKKYGKITTLQTLPYQPDESSSNEKNNTNGYSKPAAASEFLRSLIKKNEQDRSKVDSIDDFAKVVQVKSKKG
ncbi:hypothetical protein PICMEDRAFT_68130 [Pichia membranifaciens NRRL Y-2026]|uniref:Zn(2)-C6 fungal-type domain-containing protein n=1 Tax=Pichia membranifaciens NRRL Y-2026 TaxID=763406 RepID=A0A1E3NMV1_9ASCO|nr:hypothetical protein PICMEDRAFT_68130 [Pichia membranifaciens NRRL Y-2026]ODQ46723.1 hypothetical protein PICMEDRAFT_68130 [Pichia membranifaciens NRRL Y-2026]